MSVGHFKNQHFIPYFRRGREGGFQKEYVLYARVNVDNYGRSLSVFRTLVKGVGGCSGPISKYLRMEKTQERLRLPLIAKIGH